jgi:hypothetical protein
MGSGSGAGATKGLTKNVSANQAVATGDAAERPRDPEAAAQAIKGTRKGGTEPSSCASPPSAGLDAGSEWGVTMGPGTGVVSVPAECVRGASAGVRPLPPRGAPPTPPPGSSSGDPGSRPGPSGAGGGDGRFAPHRRLRPSGSRDDGLSTGGYVYVGGPPPRSPKSSEQQQYNNGGVWGGGFRDHHHLSSQSGGGVGTAGGAGAGSGGGMVRNSSRDSLLGGLGRLGTGSSVAGGGRGGGAFHHLHPHDPPPLLSTSSPLGTPRVSAVDLPTPVLIKPRHRRREPPAPYRVSCSSAYPALFASCAAPLREHHSSE